MGGEKGHGFVQILSLCPVLIPAARLSPCLFFSFRYSRIVSTKAIVDKTANKCRSERTALPGDRAAVSDPNPLLCPLLQEVPSTQCQGRASKAFTLVGI